VHATPPPPGLIAPSPYPLHGTCIPEPRPGLTAAEWRARHDGFVARARNGGIDVLFIGDSITDFFPTRGKDVWQREIAPLGSVADFGIAGDRTQWLLWRVQNGELDGSGARVVVLMIGTNNLGSATPANVARGIASIVATVRAKLPGAIVILNAILPRGAPDDPLRARTAATNALIAPLADGVQVRWLDAGPGFLNADGTIPPALMPDGLHPSNDGYEIWATALRPVLLDSLSK